MVVGFFHLILLSLPLPQSSGAPQLLPWLSQITQRATLGHTLAIDHISNSEQANLDQGEVDALGFNRQQQQLFSIRTSPLARMGRRLQQFGERMVQMVMEGTRRLPIIFPGQGGRGGGGGRPSSQRAIQQVIQQGGFQGGGGEDHQLPPRVSSPSSFYPPRPTSSGNQHSFSFPQPTYSKWQPEETKETESPSPSKPPGSKTIFPFSPSLPSPAQEDSYGSPLAPLLSFEEPSSSILTEEQFVGSSSLWDSSPPNSLPIVFPPPSPSSSPALSSTSSSSFPSITSTFSSATLHSPTNLEFSVDEATPQNTVSSSLEVDLTGVDGKDDLPKTPPTESSNIQLVLPAQSTEFPTIGSNPDPDIALAIKIVSPFISPSEDEGDQAGVAQQPSDPFPDQENPGRYFTNDPDIIEQVQKKPLFYQDTVQAHSTDCSLRKWLAVCRDFENQPADLFQ